MPKDEWKHTARRDVAMSTEQGLELYLEEQASMKRRPPLPKESATGDAEEKVSARPKRVLLRVNPTRDADEEIPARPEQDTPGDRALSPTASGSKGRVVCEKCRAENGVIRVKLIDREKGGWIGRNLCRECSMKL